MFQEFLKLNQKIVLKHISIAPSFFVDNRTDVGAFKFALYTLLVFLYNVFPALTCLIPMTRVLFTYHSC